MNLIQTEINVLRLREDRARHDYERAVNRPHSAVLGTEHARAVASRRAQWHAIRDNRIALEKHL